MMLLFCLSFDLMGFLGTRLIDLYFKTLDLQEVLEKCTDASSVCLQVLD